MTYQWYPGHMTKTVRELEGQIRLIDIVIEIVDARIPYSGRNPDLERLAAGRTRMILFGKTDLADPELTRGWMERYKKEGLHPVAADLRNKGDIKGLGPKIREVCHEKIECDRRRGIQNRPIRAMVVGIPNVGKSTFINTISGSASLKTGNKPGVTRGRQWIRLGKDVELLDTPGLLWPRFEDQTVGRNIALVGSMPDDVVNTEELAIELLKFLEEYYPYCISGRYGVGDGCAKDNLQDEYADGSEGERAADGMKVEHAGSESERVADGMKVEHSYIVKSNGAGKNFEEAEPPSEGTAFCGNARYSSLLTEIGRARGCLKKGGEVDTEKAAHVLLEDFRSGRLGRITLDRPG